MDHLPVLMDLSLDIVDLAKTMTNIFTIKDSDEALIGNMVGLTNSLQCFKSKLSIYYELEYSKLGLFRFESL